jgi:hypothetical protein
MNDRTEYMRLYGQRRRQDPAYKAKQAEWNKVWRDENANTPERMARKAEQMRKYAKAHGTAEHHKARRKVRHEIEMGRMSRQPCEVCGAKKVHAHHDDYSRPLDVRWLCPEHHREHHAKATGEQQ